VTDFLPTASLDQLRRRSELLRQLRAFFERRGFWEVETPLLSADTVIDRHLDPILVEHPLGRSTPQPYWLQTSPEYGMKRLLAAGATAIYQVTRAFRRDEWGPLHNPEFTMVEWYRTGDDLAGGMQLLAELADGLLSYGPAEQVTYDDVFRKHLGVDPHRASCGELRAAANQREISIPSSLADDDRDSWLHLLMAEFIQPRLGVTHPLILYDYPASQAALARTRPEDPPVAERFELFCHGIELANGYHELLDADVLADRHRRENQWRLRDGKVALPEHSRLLEAMRVGLPACTGVALGFDRLVMVAVGAKSLAEVMAFPFPRA
jgi:lysyl-tRNA synthetase class 2